MLKIWNPTRLGRNDGVTLVEATVVLAVSAILVTVIAPVASRTVDSARVTRALDDVDAISTAIDNFMTDFASFTPFTITGTSGGSTVEMLVSDGDIPALGTGNASWTNVVKTSGAPFVDFLERHLVTNTPGGSGVYPNSSTGWRGAYINAPVDPDPWGNRYAVNVNYLRTTTTNDVFVLSAGPDEEVDTAFAVNGVTPGDDDITSVVRRDVGKTVP